jgi:hypothetical protein
MMMFKGFYDCDTPLTNGKNFAMPMMKERESIQHDQVLTVLEPRNDRYGKVLCQHPVHCWYKYQVLQLKSVNGGTRYSTLVQSPVEVEWYR